MRASTRILSQRALHGHISNNPIRETSQQFKIELNTNSFGIVTYEKQDDIYDLVHSSIPEEYQGKGLGNLLATVRICTIFKVSTSLNLFFASI